MKRNFLLLLCVFALVAACLASCNNNTTCEHTFSDAWETDANNHWHAATCEHGEIKDSLASHVDADEDGVCDVCAYASGHIHTFESKWTYDESNHWKVATCSHSDVQGELSLHSDEDMNGSCDVCTGHVHKVNGAGYCVHSDCGKKVKDVDETDLTALVNAVMLQKYLVNGGSVLYDFYGPSNTSSEYEATKLDTVNYVFGKDNFTYVKVATDSNNAGVAGDGYYETWHQLIAPETTFGVFSEDGGDLVLDMSNVGKLQGYYIALSTLAGDYGAEETLYALYEAAIGDIIGELEVYPDPSDNKITFKYNFKTVFINSSDVTTGDGGRDTVHNVNYFEVEVTFTYSDDFALTGFVILVDCYTNDPGTADGYGFLEPDVDLDYDPDTDTFTLRENALPNTYTITVTQTLGERTEVNPYPQEKFIPTGFDFYLGYDSETGVLSDKLTSNNVISNVKEFVRFYVGDCTPEGTSLHFVHDIVSFKLYKDGVEVENPDDYSNEVCIAMFTFSGEQRSFFVYPKEDGAYKLSVYIGENCVKEISILVGSVSDENLDLAPNEFAARVTESYSWSNEVIFTATETGTYYFNLPAGIGFVDADAFDKAEATEATNDSPNPYFDFQQGGNENGGSFSLDLEEGQSIRFYASADRVGTFVISYYVI